MILRGKERSPAPTRRMLHAHGRKEVFGEPDSYRNVFSGAIGRYFFGRREQFEGLTREEAAQGKARRCSVPGYVCHRSAQEGGRWGRTVVQLEERKEKRNTVRETPLKKKNYCHMNSLPPRLI